VYCSSSQAVKQKYRHSRPKPGVYCTRRPVAGEGGLTRDGLTATGRISQGRRDEDVLEGRRTLPGPVAPAKDGAAMTDAVRNTFERLGQTRLELAALAFRNTDRCFVPVSRLNQLRRDLTAGLEEALRDAAGQRVARIQAEFCPRQPDTPLRP